MTDTKIQPQSDSAPATDAWLTIGKIVGSQGLSGEVRVYPNSDFPERFLEPGDRWLRYPGQSDPQSIQLIAGRFLSKKGLYVVQFAGVTDRTQAEQLKNCQLLVPEGDRLPVEEGEFHVLDLLGLTVVEQQHQRPIGTVVDIIAAGNDLLDVELLPTSSPAATSDKATVEPMDDAPPHPDQRAKAAQSRRRKQRKHKKKSANRRVLIPFVYDIVPVVDLEQQRIEITPPSGLLEI